MVELETLAFLFNHWDDINILWCVRTLFCQLVAELT